MLGWLGVTLEERPRLTRFGDVRFACVIVHTETGWRVISACKASLRRLGVRSAREVGPCVMEETSAVNTLDNIARTISRSSLRRSRESRSAAGAGKDIVTYTVVLLKAWPSFRKCDKDLASQLAPSEGAGRSRSAESRRCLLRSRRSWRLASSARRGSPWCNRIRHGPGSP